MPLLADRVLESSITAGTGTLTLAGALTGYRTFNSAFSNGNIVYYTIDDGLGNWEVGYGTVGTGTLTRSTVLESSNANALVVFTSVSKRVFCTAPVPALLPDQTGNSTKILSTDGTNPSWIANTVGTVTSVGGTGTVNGITLTGTVTTSGAITLGGTLSGVSLTTQVSGTLPVLNGGTGVTTSTGTGSVVLSASPTFTGTVNTANLAYTGTLTGGTGVVAIGTNQIYKDASGNVGIGTTSPSEKLMVQSGNIYINGGFLKSNRSSGVADTVGGLVLQIDGGTQAQITTPSASTMAFYTGSTETMRINSSGNVGIGTSSPAYKLDVSGSGSQVVRVITTDTSGANIGRLIAQYTGGGGGVASTVDLRAGSGYTFLTSTTSTPLLFGVNSTEYMRIATSGNIGIGVAIPAQKLSVAGTIESTTGGVKFPDGTTQTTAATAGITTGKAIAMAMIFGF